MKLESQLAFTIYNYNTTPEPASRLQIYKQNIRELFYRYNWSNTIIERIQDQDTQQPSTSTSIVFLWEELTLTIPVVVVIPSLKTGNENENIEELINLTHAALSLGYQIHYRLSFNRKSSIIRNPGILKEAIGKLLRVKRECGFLKEKNIDFREEDTRLKLKSFIYPKNSCLFQLPSHFGLPRFRKNDDISVCFTYTGKSWVQYPILQSILSWHKKQRSIFSVPFFQLVHIEKITSKDKNSNWRYWKKSWELLLLFKVKLRK